MPLWQGRQARRHRGEQNRWGFPPSVRGLKGVPHQGQVGRVMAYLSCGRSRCHLAAFQEGAHVEYVAIVLLALPIPIRNTATLQGFQGFASNIIRNIYASCCAWILAEDRSFPSLLRCCA